MALNLIFYMKKIKIILVFSILLNIIGLPFAVRRGYYMYQQYAVIHNQPNSLSRQSIYDLFPIDSTDIVFVGDSHTQRFDTQEFFNNPHIKNRGIEGENAIGLLQRLPQIMAGHPKKIFVETGCNDLKLNSPVDTVIENINNIITYIKKESPKTKIYINTILPSAITYNYINKYSELANKAIYKISKQENCTLIDVHSDFAQNGKLNPKYDNGDGVHLNGQGYVKWAKIIKQYL
jgi:lysophospholipase L1-like esterase